MHITGPFVQDNSASMNAQTSIDVGNEYGLRWDNLALGIDWPGSDPLLSVDSEFFRPEACQPIVEAFCEGRLYPSIPGQASIKGLLCAVRACGALRRELTRRTILQRYLFTGTILPNL